MNNMSFVKGMGVGLMVGSMVGMVAAPKKKKMDLSKTIKSMGDAVGNIAGTLGL